MKNIIFLYILLLSNMLFAAELFPKSQPRLFSIGDRLEQGATIGGYPIWDGEGKWRIFELTRRESSGGNGVSVPLGDIRVFQTENGKLVGTMLVTANLANANLRDWSDEPCKMENLLFKASIGGVFSNINCITIGHVSPYLSNPIGQSALVYSFWKEQGIDIPGTVIQITVTRYASNGRLLKIQLNINPEIVGFKKPTELDWGRSPWRFSQAFKDPAKKIFIDSLSSWALFFAKQVDIAFAYDRKDDIFLQIPSWRTVVDQNVESDLPKVKIMLD